MRAIAITARSGCNGTPDNSMESVLTGIRLGADCVEVDVRMNEQGGLWLSHDAARITPVPFRWKRRFLPSRAPMSASFPSGW